MSIIRRLLSSQDEERGNFPRGLPIWTAPTTSGQIVTPETAARSAAVTACQRVLTSTVASLPVDVIREVGSTRREVNPQPPVVRSPSGRSSQRVWVAQVMKSLTSAGNFYGQVTATDQRGFATQVESLHYGSVSWQMTADGLKPFVNGKEHDLWPLGDIVHIPASPYVQPGSPVADSPVELAKQSIGTGLAAEEFGARFFGDGFHPTAVAKVSKPDLTAEEAELIKSKIDAMRKDRRPGVFGAGIEIEFPEVNPEDSQFIDLMRFEVEQACRFFGVPPQMVYAAVSGQNVTYANVAQSDLQYLKHSVGIWLLDIEDAWSSLLPAPQVVKFNVDALLRMDATTRHDLYATRLESKTISVNQIKALEDEEPYTDPAFDEPGIPGSPAMPTTTEEP